MVATDTLSLCLKACSKLEFQQIGFDCEILEQFRKTAFQIIRNATLENSHQGQIIKRRLWELIRRVSESPMIWEGRISKVLEFGEIQFVDVIRRNLGNEISIEAEKLENLWASMVGFPDGNPLRRYIASIISGCRDEITDFRILTTGKYRSSYKSILDELELGDADVFCTSDRLRKFNPFKSLISCGPFRENDLLFTAPRYEKLVNLRWSTDNDIPGFPEHISLEFTEEDLDKRFPSSFPVNVESQINVIPIEIPFRAELKTLVNWSFDEFEQVFIKRRRRYRGYLGGGDQYQVAEGGRENSNTRMSDTTRSQVEYVKLLFFDGSFVIFPFDQQGKPPMLFSIDRESEFEIKKRRPINLSDPHGDGGSSLDRGMLVVLRPTASESLNSFASQELRIEPLHLKRWKAALKKRLHEASLEGRSILFEMQRIGVSSKYKDIENTVRRWARHQPNRIDSPSDASTFESLIGDFVGYKQWKEAWLEIKSLRGASISQGLVSNSNIDKWLKTSVERKLLEVIDSPKTILPVDGFETDVVVVEVSEIVFLTKEQVGDCPTLQYVSTDEELFGG